LIDDMEAGTGFICQGDGRVGYWYTYIDGLAGSSITPPVSESPSKPVAFSPPLGNSSHAMHASGAFSSYAGIGFLINAPVIDAAWSTYDASSRTGIEFSVKGTGYLRVLMHTPATVATQYHGTCTTSVCMGAVSRNYLLSPNVWVVIDLPFASLTSGTAPFNPGLLSAIEFQPNSAGTFDLWVDDIRFY
jgi:hypothetical protein